MDHDAGIDVSLECSSVCVVDANGKILREAKVASEPEALIAWFRAHREHQADEEQDEEVRVLAPAHEGRGTRATTGTVYEVARRATSWV